MLFSSFPRLAAAACVALAATAGAQAVVYNWTFVAGMPQPSAPGGYQVSASGGAIQAINSSFDSASKRLTFDVQMGPPSGSSSLATEGFWLVLNTGPNPKNQPGEYAIFYFDGRNFAAPKLTVYGYNGLNNGSSWSDGNGAASGAPSGDLIKGSSSGEAASFINSISAGDVSGSRKFSFDINAASIISHVPAYPATDSSPWFGTGFNDTVGIWFHPMQDFNAYYNSTGKKGLKTGTSFSKDGYLDGSFFQTAQLPAPSSLALLGGGLLLGARRRRIT